MSFGSPNLSTPYSSLPLQKWYHIHHSFKGASVVETKTIEYIKTTFRVNDNYERCPVQSGQSQLTTNCVLASK